MLNRGAKNKKKKFNDRQIRFVEEYLVDLNATRAAIRVGYSPRSAYSAGNRNLQKPHIRAEIDKRLGELSVNAKETTKMISDIARASLNNYFTVRKRWVTPEVAMPLADVIRSIEAEIEDEEEIFNTLSKISKEAIKAHQAAQDARRERIVRLRVKLKRDPKATMLVPGAPVEVEVAELDMPRLIQDKEAGRIKTAKLTEHGLQVELYPADGALRDLARVHGLFRDNLTVDAGEELKKLYKTVMKRANR